MSLRQMCLTPPTVDYIKYTILHADAVHELAVRLGLYYGHPTIWCHDDDKLVMYLTNGDEEVTKYHRAHAAHHDTTTTDRNTLIEMMLDWESAPYTKTDKPLNALGTLLEFYPEMEDRMLPIIKEFGLDKTKPHPCITKEAYTRKCEEITDEGLLYIVKRTISTVARERIKEYERLHTPLPLWQH